MLCVVVWWGGVLSFGGGGRSATLYQLSTPDIVGFAYFRPRDVDSSVHMCLLIRIQIKPSFTHKLDHTQDWGRTHDSVVCLSPFQVYRMFLFPLIHIPLVLIIFLYSLTLTQQFKCRRSLTFSLSFLFYFLSSLTLSATKDCVLILPPTTNKSIQTVL